MCIRDRHTAASAAAPFRRAVSARADYIRSGRYQLLASGMSKTNRRESSLLDAAVISAATDKCPDTERQQEASWTRNCYKRKPEPEVQLSDASLM